MRIPGQRAAALLHPCGAQFSATPQRASDDAAAEGGAAEADPFAARTGEASPVQASTGETSLRPAQIRTAQIRTAQIRTAAQRIWAGVDQVPAQVGPVADQAMGVPAQGPGSGDLGLRPPRTDAASPGQAEPLDQATADRAAL